MVKMNKNKGKGKRKIEIKRIEQIDSRYVTFSKRKGSLFKKACELSILTGAEIAILILSPGGKAFSFGHPSVDSVIDRFLAQSPQHDDSLINSYLEANKLEISQEYNAMNMQLDFEKRQGRKQLQLMQSQTEPWWEAPIDNLSLHELERFKASLENLKKSIADRITPEEQVQNAWTGSELLETNSSSYEEQMMNDWTPSDFPKSSSSSYVESNDDAEMATRSGFAANEIDELLVNNAHGPFFLSDMNASSYKELYDHLFEA